MVPALIRMVIGNTKISARTLSIISGLMNCKEKQQNIPLLENFNSSRQEILRFSLDFPFLQPLTIHVNREFLLQIECV